MIDPGAKVPDCHAITAQLVSHDHPGSVPAFHQLPHKTRRSTTISAALYKDFNGIAVGINRALQPVLLTADGNDHLIHMPFIGRAGPIPPDRRSKLRPKPLAPDPDGFMADADPTLSQNVLYVAQAERKTMV